MPHRDARCCCCACAWRPPRPPQHAARAPQTLPARRPALTHPTLPLFPPAPAQSARAPTPHRERSGRRRRSLPRRLRRSAAGRRSVLRLLSLAWRAAAGSCVEAGTNLRHLAHACVVIGLRTERVWGCGGCQRGGSPTTPPSPPVQPHPPHIYSLAP
eukprot:186959-Chlamydomonas_euryale.AAC.1